MIDLMTETTSRFPDVRKQVAVPTDPATAFRLFFEHPLDWWPPTHVLVPGRRVELTFGHEAGEPYLERDDDGNEATWGRIIEFDRPHYVRFSWQIDGNWQPVEDDDKSSRIEVTFSSDGDATIVELAHVELHRHGDDAEKIWTALQGPSPGETLERYGAYVCRTVMGTSGQGGPS